MTTFTLTPIGFISTCFPEKFGIPRQPLLAPSAKGQLRLLAPFNNPDCVSGLEHSSHLWLQFIFHEHTDKQWKPKVRPPRLGGNEKLGVFASRSPFRPNNIGLSTAKLDSIEITKDETILHLSGIDLVDGTPVIDIKPYIPYADAIYDASNTIADEPPKHTPVVLSPEAEDFVQQYQQKTQIDLGQLIIEVLQQSPQPAYQNNGTDRIYGITLYDCNIQWRAINKDQQTMIEVLSVKQI